ncbi:MAG TPA: glycosyltransferase family 2 protein [Chloroflexota bacterium]|nr:glycosyltransferase family 2 protein [Chloroflexota bacterium]
MTFQPIHVTKIELSSPLPSITAVDPAKGLRYSAVQLLVRLHNHPLGLLELPLPEETLLPAVYAPAVWAALGEAINAHLEQDGWLRLTELPLAGISQPDTPLCQQEEARLLENAPLISVVICTHERPSMLDDCLASVLALDYPQYEVVVVDNAPRTDSTRQVVQGKYGHVPHLRYVVEPNQGQCWARNTGAMAARGEIIANTDDDVIVDPHWLIGVLRGFAAADNVGGVNGLTIPAELDTVEQLWFEQSGGFNKGYERQIYDMGAHKPARPFYPLSAGLFGTGANLAIKKSALEKVGYFDPALGAGTITTCGDDLAMYVQLLFAGYQLVYEPTAFLQHIHRREYVALQKQIYNYGVGFAAFITKTMWDNPGRIPGFVLRIPYGLYLLLSPQSFKNTKKQANYPADLNGLELRGMLYGSYAYLKSRRQTRRLLRQRRDAGN